MKLENIIKNLQNFEQDIANEYKAGKIRAPIHLRGSNDEYYERCMIDLYENFNISATEDWVFGYWDMHIPALLKGIPRDLLKKEILDGNSIALNFPEYKFHCSGIVGSLMGVATGVAWSIKNGLRPSHERVFIHLGDMSAETGIFFESLKYADNFDLPIMFIVADNGISVMTETKKVWRNDGIPWFMCDELADSNKLYYFKYYNKWPHSGISERIKF